MATVDEPRLQRMQRVYRAMDGRPLTVREVAQRPLLGMISMLPTHSLRVMRRRAALLFAGGVGGLIASYGAAFAFFFLTIRGS